MKRVLSVISGIKPTRIFASVLVGLGAGVISGAYVTPYNVVTDVTIREVDSVRAHQHELDLLFTLTRLVDCDARVERWVWTWVDVPEGILPGGAQRIPRWIQLRNNGNNPPTKIGTSDSYLLTVALPPNVTPGVWFYWSRTHDKCGWQSFIRGENIRIGTSVAFTVGED